jgi:hypothetical protein
MGVLCMLKKSVESKARAYFWQMDVKFGRKKELNIKLWASNFRVFPLTK